jgi:hypothetical protein
MSRQWAFVVRPDPDPKTAPQGGCPPKQSIWRVSLGNDILKPALFLIATSFYETTHTKPVAPPPILVTT